MPVLAGEVSAGRACRVVFVIQMFRALPRPVGGAQYLLFGVHPSASGSSARGPCMQQRVKTIRPRVPLVPTQEPETQVQSRGEPVRLWPPYRRPTAAPERRRHTDPRPRLASAGGPGRQWHPSFSCTGRCWPRHDSQRCRASQVWLLPAAAVWSGTRQTRTGAQLLGRCRQLLPPQVDDVLIHLLEVVVLQL